MTPPLPGCTSTVPVNLRPPAAPSPSPLPLPSLAAHHPHPLQGPTMTMRVRNYSLIRDVQSAAVRPRVPANAFKVRV